MSSIAHPAARAAAASTMSPDRIYRIWQTEEYPKELWWMLSAVLGIFTIVHSYALLSTWLRTRNLLRQNAAKTGAGTRNIIIFNEKKGGEFIAPGRNGKVSLRRLPLSALSALRIALFRWSIPLAAVHRMCLSEMVFNLAYIGALLAWCFTHSPQMAPAYWANRAGDLTTSQIPLIVALAGKNNLISFLTGVGPEKLNVLHRASARATLILVWVHAFGRWKMGFTSYASLSLPDIQWGVVSMAAFSLATILSFRPIRNLAYEVFLIGHIVLIFVFLLAGYLHMPEVGYRILPGFGLWGLDRLLRTIRLIVQNRLWLSIVPRRKSDASRVSVERVSEDTVRLTLTRKVTWKAGQHFYLVLPSVSGLPFESHPFTAASIPHSLDGTSNEEKELSFVIRGRDGFTGRLLQTAVNRGGATSLRAYVDGPYGCPPTLGFYNTCILISGGSGVTYTLPLLLDLVHRAQKGTTTVRKVVFIWAIRDIAHLDWISKPLATAVLCAPSSLTIDLRIFVSQSRPQITVVRGLSQESDAPTLAGTPDCSMEDKKHSFLTGLEGIKIESGRPNLTRILREEVDSAPGPVSVDVSGPAALSATVRSALSSDIAGPVGVLKGKPTVTLHVVGIIYTPSLLLDNPDELFIGGVRMVVDPTLS
ncbi:hypothetical protein BOTBODRAFT_183772 [Botryobasidium botryosum FD-172 SS1]|uniref:ferric-chelate reductase (NADPH) n=1 Tax=Botryobasidium botryosum (strain FD-172 SS1) TaxID=930990 RepID=A0A067NBF7_BOTB1|nr:hypothetical protein BOTBODRAFT_183772 [Botryobasidium botryosum FD-172 SS1]